VLDVILFTDIRKVWPLLLQFSTKEYHVQLSYLTINVDSTDGDLFTPVSKVWLSQSRSSWHSQAGFFFFFYFSHPELHQTETKVLKIPVQIHPCPQYIMAWTTPIFKKLIPPLSVKTQPLESLVPPLGKPQTHNAM
jgi:hypothetical protein